MAVVRGSLFSGRAAAQHDDADGSHQQGQTGDDQAPVVFVKQGTAQQGGVREFSVVYLLTDGGAFRIEVGGTLGGRVFYLYIPVLEGAASSCPIFKSFQACSALAIGQRCVSLAPGKE